MYYERKKQERCKKLERNIKMFLFRKDYLYLVESIEYYIREHSLEKKDER